jgi:acyl-CoA hydrolase
VLALASRTNDGASRIVTSLPEGRTATTSGAYVDAIVTEHGVAVLRGLAPEQRAAAIIAIAHPDDRAGLAGAMEVARQRR